MVLTSKLAGGVRRDSRTAAWLVALSPLLCGALLRTHLDLVVAALLLGGLLAIVKDREPLGFALFGLGAMTKLVPALAALVAIALAARARGGAQSALFGALVFLATCALISSRSLVAGYVDAYTFHLDRPVQIESTPASVLLAVGGSYVTGDPIRPDRFKSNGLAGGAAGPSRRSSPSFSSLAVALAVAKALAARAATPRTSCSPPSPPCSPSSPSARSSRPST